MKGMLRNRVIACMVLMTAALPVPARADSTVVLTAPYTSAYDSSLGGVGNPCVPLACSGRADTDGTLSIDLNWTPKPVGFCDRTGCFHSSASGSIVAVFDLKESARWLDVEYLIHIRSAVAKADAIRGTPLASATIRGLDDRWTETAEIVDVNRTASREDETLIVHAVQQTSSGNIEPGEIRLGVHLWAHTEIRHILGSACAPWLVCVAANTGVGTAEVSVRAELKSVTIHVRT